ncbi:hypothetical protein BJY24_007027 [Nocardia transvalensis]|uniref:Uncharacterized protein n=1 Tax=Nocardia transvalensis TaxID=37333 RepID=A0A7W9PLI2_9NOCA|nr:hypothetical protein [Nocardia transvalensis]MBB5918115.1 hypothetical protein [Nocardia transvalensis]
MLRVHLHHTGHRPLLPALRDYARRSAGLFRAAAPGPRGAAAERPAVFSASLGCHPHF